MAFFGERDSSRRGLWVLMLGWVGWLVGLEMLAGWSMPDMVGLPFTVKKPLQASRLGGSCLLCGAKLPPQVPLVETP